MRRNLGNLLKTGNVVTLTGKAFENGLVSRIGHCFLTRHDPAVIARRMADYGPLVIGVEIQDQIGRRDEAAEEFDPPLGIGLLIYDIGVRGDFAFRRAEGAFVGYEPIVNGPVREKGITFNGIDATSFREVRNFRDDAPVTHVTGEIDVSDSPEGRALAGASGQEGGGGDKDEGMEKTGGFHKMNTR